LRDYVVSANIGGNYVFQLAYGFEIILFVYTEYWVACRLLGTAGFSEIARALKSRTLTLECVSALSEIVKAAGW
jgi:hypothetical protein